FASTCYSQYTATADIYTLSLHDALPILVEVGVNVPNATIMVIYDAERFGLSQLHQLRGRVGRGDKQSYCILIADPKSETGKERIDRKSTRLNSSHVKNSYAVFCLKKKIK